MDFSLYFLNKSFFENRTPEDAVNWLHGSVSDEKLAEAYRIVSEHIGLLMTGLDEYDDPWAEQAADKWQDVLKEIVAVITERMVRDGMQVCEDQGHAGKVQPFLVKYLKDLYDN